MRDIEKLSKELQNDRTEVTINQNNLFKLK
jgi:hypothetical protein